MKKYLIAGVAALGSAGAANAATQPSIQFTNGVYTIPASTNAQVFEDFRLGGTDAQSNTQFSPGLADPSTYAQTSSGDVRIQPNGFNVVSDSVDPSPGGNNYLSIVNGSFTVALTGGVQVFSFILGSLDTYNSVDLSFADGTIQTLKGLGIVQGAAFNTPDGTAPASPGQTGRVTYDAQGGSAITGVTFRSTQAAFEIDQLAAAAPEPAAWALMIMGFGLVGSTLRARRRKTTVSFA